MKKVAMVGYGTVGHGVLEVLKNDTELDVTQVIVPKREVASVSKELPNKAVVSSLKTTPTRPDILFECASSGAVEEHVLSALRLGIDCVVCTISAFAKYGLVEIVESTARKHGTQVRLLSGAVGGIDAISAASVGGLSRVTHIGTKPALSWKGTPAEESLDLGNLTEATAFFEGPARDAASLYPDCANVAAMVSIAGIGLERTKVRLIADPKASQNTHHIMASGSFGEMELRFTGLPLPSNPKTSALTVYNAVKVLRSFASPISTSC